MRALIPHALGPRAAGLAGSREKPLLTHQALGAEQCVGAGPAGRGGAERRATLRALRELQTRAASLAPTPAGSMTPRWLAGRGGVG